MKINRLAHLIPGTVVAVLTDTEPARWIVGAVRWGGKSGNRVVPDEGYGQSVSGYRVDRVVVL